MADLTIQKAALGGLLPTLAAATAGGDAALNDGDVLFVVKNGGGSSVTVTAVAQTKCNHGTLHDGTMAVGAGETKYMGPFDPSRFNDANGKVNFTYTGVASVTVGIIDPRP